MDWSSSSNTDDSAKLLLFAFGFLAMVAMFIVATFIARANTARALRHRAQVQAQWRPIFMGLISLHLLPSKLPSVPQRDALEFARFWIENLNRIDGDGRQKLLALGTQLGLAAKLRRHLRSVHLGHRVLALCVAGRLEDVGALPAIRKALYSSNPTVSFTAAMALVRIEGIRCKEAVLDRACEGDWGAPYIAQILRELQLENTTKEMHRMLKAHGPKQGGNLLQAWAQVDYSASAQYARDILANPRNEGWLLCGSLRVLRSPSDATLVRGYLAHQQWSVRVQAVNAMARVGLRGDIESLTPMMEEENWWLQERVLDAVKGHPQFNAKAAQQLTRQMQDRVRQKT